MPTYEYQCTACGHQLEAFQKMSDAPLTECPACHQQSLSKQLSAAGFQLKGTGWYKTDYAAPKSTASATDTTTSTDTKKTDSSNDSSSQSGAA